ncbi:YqjF family protein [Microbacterium sp. M1A1_1b]
MTAGRIDGGGSGLQSVSSAAPALTGRPWISQDWLDVVFVHWRVDVSAVAPLLPAGTRPDTMALDGSDDDVTTWVGLIGFRFTDTRFPPLGRLGRTGSIGDFVEVNVRVYTRDDQGRRGVAFLSLDAGKFLPTLGARVATGLPYWWADAETRKRDGRVGYAMRRHGTHVRSTFDVRVEPQVAEPTALETFLTARWGMHVHRAGRTQFWPNEHASWELHRASVVSLRDDLVRAAGLPFALTTLEPDSVLYSPGVTTRFGAGRG